ncbi:5-(carboxyamino)imidazole ribonucleotide synthase [Gloeocapsa sp. PCC 73106]|uniref:5-(carboxyamino)imidazole ribonucleotide synthase n=1 Tax=Gloeocapsa sp. PCC 73106 TaxID=102232 RepID=UPI0002ACE73A|nr:5-(carboxyamino)imidazole ribonucleotide synthase [Gloeocapsa sp. PCC 73106]ELR97544.1 phosphoribosylaminoimidazole carboxylase, PurK protein [Gloeocapsa sp. PCC 73106]
MKSKRVGVIGGGQLAAMMHPGATKLGIDLIVQTPGRDDPGAIRATQVILGTPQDAIATAKLATLCDVITFENEFVDLEALETLADQGVCFRPSLTSLAPLLDKYQQRYYLKQIGLPVPEFQSLTTPEDINHLSDFPLVLKARRHGYDGQGTFILHNRVELAQTWEKLGYPPMLVESYVPFTRELAVMAARNSQGDIAIYSVVETQQQGQVCRRVYVPAGIGSEIKTQIEVIARILLEKLEIVGIIGIEFFLTADNQLLVNEIAPRTHNSGHYTIEACNTSQFEMQLRAIADLSLGDPSLTTRGAVMVNLLGYEHCFDNYASKRHQLAAIPHTTVHWYDKAESRPGRKLGHVTTLLADDQDLEILPSLAQRIESIWYGDLK